jgi:purine-cytosine permease-like protein
MPLLDSTEGKIGLLVTGVIISFIIIISQFFKVKRMMRNNEIDSKEAAKIMQKYSYVATVIIFFFGFPYFLDTFFK